MGTFGRECGIKSCTTLGGHRWQFTNIFDDAVAGDNGSQQIFNDIFSDDIIDSNELTMEVAIPREMVSTARAI